MRAWAEPSFAAALTTDDEAARDHTMNALFGHIADALTRQPHRCDWKIALLRIARRR
jgi:hypothetical protein